MKSGDSCCHHLSAIPPFSRCQEPHCPYSKASRLIQSRGSKVFEPIRTRAWGLGARKEELVYISQIYKSFLISKILITCELEKAKCQSIR